MRTPELRSPGDTGTHHGRDGRILASVVTPKPELWRSVGWEAAKRMLVPERQNLSKIKLTSASLDKLPGLTETAQTPALEGAGGGAWAGPRPTRGGAWTVSGLEREHLGIPVKRM